MATNAQPDRDALEASSASDAGYQGPEQAPPQSKRRRRRWWIRVPLCLLVLLIVLIALAPYLVSTATGSRLILSQVNGQIQGRVGVEKLSLSWRGPTKLTGLTVADPAGKEVLTIGHIAWPGGVWTALRSWQRLGEISINSPRAVLYIDEHHQISLVQAFSLRRPAVSTGAVVLPSLSGRVILNKGSVRLVQADGRTYDVPQLDAQCDVDAMRDLKGTVHATLADTSPLAVDATVQQLTTKGQLDVSQASGQIRVATGGDVDIAGLTQFVMDQVSAAGKANLDAKLTFKPGETLVDLKSRATGIQMAGAEVTQVNPTDLAIEGRARMVSSTISADVSLTGQAGRAQVRMAYTPSDRPVQVSTQQLLSAVLTGNEIATPDLTVDASANVNLATLAQAVPGLLHIRPGAQITGGQLEIENLSIRGGAQPTLKGSLRLTELTAVDNGRTTRWEPIVAEWDVLLEANRGLKIHRTEVESAFARVVASGTASELHADLTADLAKLNQQLGQVVDIGLQTPAGKITGTLGVKRAGDDRIDMTCDLVASDLRYQTQKGSLEAAKAALKQTGYLELASGRVTKIVASSFTVDVDGQIVASGSGWFDLQHGTYAADADVKNADLAYLGSKTAGFGVKGLDRYAGTAVVQAKIDRASAEGPMVSSGQATLRNVTLDGEPLAKQDTVLGWSDVRWSPELGTLGVDTAELSSDVAHATARQVLLKTREGLTLDGKFEATADLAQCLATVGRIGQWKTPPQVAGRMTLTGTCASAAGNMIATGNGRIDSFEIGTGRQVVHEDRVEFVYDAAINTREENVAIKQFELASKLLSAKMTGTIDHYATVRVLDLSGSYEGSWDSITALIHELAPATRDTLSFAGTTAGAFTVKGPAHQPEIRPVYRGVATGLDISWTSVKAYGVALGSAKLSPTLRDGELTIPVTAIPASLGQVHLGGVIDLRTPDPTFRLPGKVLVVEGAQITPEVGRHVLSRINPIFAFMTRAEGTLSLATEDIVLPLSDQIRQSGSGKGRLDLKNFKVQFGGPMALLIELGAMDKQETLAVTMDGVDFTLRDGRIWYDNLTMVFPENFDLKFSGSVGLDETVDLTVSVPVRAALLDKFGVRGPVTEYARLLEGARVAVPMTGNRLLPKVDLSRVDMKPLVERAMRAAVTKEAPGILDTLRKPKQEPTDGTPTKQPPSTQPPAKPLEDATKRLLDDLLKDRKKSDRPAPKKR
ncbi:MAG: hypothetical protein QUV05_10420 [Phycisphaerae bacterium]|nr:hypothetical protein [Phycisphaerae bacterium]